MNYDLVVIGGGTAGLVSSVVAKSLGAKVLLVEGARIGGECLWSGCVPSKTLIQSARVMATLARAAEFGVHAENIKPRWAAIRLRIAAVRDEIRANEQSEIKKANLEILKGTARFTDANTLCVQTEGGEKTIRARKFVLAVGMKNKIPVISGLEETGFLTSETVFEMPALPRSLGIIGGGPVACELAQALARLGCKVTVLQKGARLLPIEDEEVSQSAQTILQNDGVKVRLNSGVLSARQGEEKKYLRVRDENGEAEIGFSELLVSIGKEARLDDLNLAAANVAWSEKGIEVNANLRTSARNIWACGDCIGRFLFTHFAEHSATVAAQNALLPVKAKVETRVVPWTTFLDPEIARVGLTQEEAGHNCKIYRAEFKDLDRAIIEGETEGFLKIVASASGRILGAHIVGARAGELIHPFVLAVRDGMLVSEFADTIHVYPTLSEIGHRAGQEFYRELLENKLVKKILPLVVK